MRLYFEFNWYMFCAGKVLQYKLYVYFDFFPLIKVLSNLSNGNVGGTLTTIESRYLQNIVQKFLIIIYKHLCLRKSARI